MSETKQIIELTAEQYFLIGRERFGNDPDEWQFVCPACGHVACGNDFAEFIADPEPLFCVELARSECLGRYLPVDERAASFGTETGDVVRPCDYAGYGLFKLSPWRIKTPEGEIRSFAMSGGDP